LTVAETTKTLKEEKHQLVQEKHQLVQENSDLHKEVAKLTAGALPAVMTHSSRLFSPTSPLVCRLDR
jgi:cell division protein FtsB